MRVGVVGINHKLADLKLREHLAKACQRRFGPGGSLHGNHHFILLSTCNRTEVYFSSDDLTETHIYLLNILRNEVEEDFDHKLYSYFGVDCFSHLVRVTVGLDSAIVAETEIQGQVKAAYETSAESSILPKELHYLFQKSLGMGKKVRTELQLGRGMPNLEHAVYKTGEHFFQDLSKTKILFVGASEINQKILGYFKTKNFSNICLCNRSEENAWKIVKGHSIEMLDWELLHRWTEYDWIVFGTKSPDYLITHQPIQFERPKLIMDLCVPRNVDPKLARNSNVTLLNIDQLNRLLKIRHRTMHDSLLAAEEIIFNLTHQQVNRYVAREQSKMVPLLVTA